MYFLGCCSSFWTRYTVCSYCASSSWVCMASNWYTQKKNTESIHLLVVGLTKQTLRNLQFLISSLHPKMSQRRKSKAMPMSSARMVSVATSRHTAPCGMAGWEPVLIWTVKKAMLNTDEGKRNFMFFLEKWLLTPMEQVHPGCRLLWEVSRVNSYFVP